MSTTIQRSTKEMAEVLYAKGPSQDGPHPGRVCTGVKPMPEFDEVETAENESDLYVEIPMAAASRKCLARAATEATSSDEKGEIRTQVKNNHLYVPLDHLHDTYRSYAKRSFGRLQAVQEDELESHNASGSESTRRRSPSGLTTPSKSASMRRCGKTGIKASRSSDYSKMLCERRHTLRSVSSIPLANCPTRLKHTSQRTRVNELS